MWSHWFLHHFHHNKIKNKKNKKNIHTCELVAGRVGPLFPWVEVVEEVVMTEQMVRLPVWAPRSVSDAFECS